MKLLKRASIRVIIFLNIKVKSLNNLLESILIEFSLSLVNIFTVPNQIRNKVRRVIKTLIIEEYFFIRAIFATNRNQNNYSKKEDKPKIKFFYQLKLHYAAYISLPHLKRLFVLDSFEYE